MTKQILFPFLMCTWQKIFIFLNGHSEHWLCNAVDFGPQVSCTCIHVIRDGTSLSCPLSLKRKVRYARQRSACRSWKHRNWSWMLLLVLSYLFDMPNVYFETVFFLLSGCVVIPVRSVTRHASHPVWAFTTLNNKAICQVNLMTPQPHFLDILPQE